MKAVKPILRRKLADEEIVRATDHYFAEGGVALEGRFIDAIEAAFDHVARWPGTGSARYATHVQREGLRFWQTKHFPYLIFYVELAEHIDVLRVLHASQDIPATLWEEQGNAGSDS